MSTDLARVFPVPCFGTRFGLWTAIKTDADKSNYLEEQENAFLSSLYVPVYGGGKKAFLTKLRLRRVGEIEKEKRSLCESVCLYPVGKALAG